MGTLVSQEIMSLNKESIKVIKNETVKTGNETDGWNVFTITPGAISTEGQLLYGSKVMPIETTAGGEYPYPIVGEFLNSVVQIKNISDNTKAEFNSGWYALSAKADITLNSSDKKVSQYTTIATQASSGNQTLKLKAVPGQAVLAIVIVGGNEPMPVFLNTTKDNISPAWKDLLPNAKFESGSNYTESKNYFGQTVFIVNVSLNSSDTFTAALV